MEIVLGVVLGLLGVVLAGLAAFVAARRAGRRPPLADTAPPAARDPEQDDLPGFLELPPGAGSPPADAAAGWPSLAAPAPVAPTPAAPRSKDSRAAPGAIAVVAVLLVALGVAVAASDSDPHDRPHGSPAPGSQPPATPAPGTAGALADQTVPVGDDGTAARLAFGGAVLERHAVGITATYPHLRLTSDGRRAVAHLELPTFHCLAAEAPGDPVAAGCSRSLAEYADLGSPGLRVTRSGDRMRLSGEFATYVRPNGGPAEWTGRTYRIDVTVRAVDRGTAPEGWQPAEGVLVVGDDRARTTGDAEVNAVRLGS